jgi:hypothetical protein
MFTFRKNNKNSKKRVSDHKMEMLRKQGTEQFKILIKKGLGVPVMFL